MAAAVATVFYMRPSSLLHLEGEPLDLLFFDYELVQRVAEARSEEHQSAAAAKTKAAQLEKAYGPAPDAAQVKDFLAVP